MGNKLLCALLALTLMLSLAACGSDSGVSVQRADQLAIVGQAGERYAAMVVSENVTNIQRDSSKSILEVYVTVGQEVKAGDKLFTYDSEALELDLEKAQLELEKMKNEQITYAEQLEKLEKQLANTWNESAKMRLTLEINTLKTTQLENDYGIIAKEKSIEDIQTTLQSVDILCPVDGIIRQIDDKEDAQSFITIQQHGAYRVKGNLNEMSMMGGLMMGTPVRAYSRVEAGKFWSGVVTTIDTEDSSQDNSDMWYYGNSDPMNTSSQYVFYVELENTEGLLLGQHLYVEMAPPEGMPGLWIPEAFFANLGFNEETGESTADMWVANASGKLELRTVTLGMYDGMSGCYEILSGLTAQEYVADPVNPGCESGASVIYREPADFSAGVTEEAPAEIPSEEASAAETDVPMVTPAVVEEESLPADTATEEGQ